VIDVHRDPEILLIRIGWDILFLSNASEKCITLLKKLKMRDLGGSRERRVNTKKSSYFLITGGNYSRTYCNQFIPSCILWGSDLFVVASIVSGFVFFCPLQIVLVCVHILGQILP